MSFLAPLFLLGGLAVALPVVFHLVRRSSRERMNFSSLMFLAPTPPRMTRRNRLEHIFLLLLRCLAIAILSLGFARPFLQKIMPAAPQESAAMRTVLLVDTSASMRRAELWPAALARAEAALKNASPADQMAVFTFDDRVRPVVSFEQWAALAVADRAVQAAQRLAAAGPTWRSTHLGNALTAAAEALEEAEKTEARPAAKRIILVSDLQEGSRLDSLEGYEWPRGIEVVVEAVKARRPTNASLQWVVDAADSAPAATDAGVRLRVSNSADARHEQFQVRWEGAAGGASLDAYVPPGQSRIMSAPKLPAGAPGERIALSGDDDDFDNAVYLVQPKPEEISVLFLGDDAENDPAQLLYYLKRAFQDTRRQTVRITAAGAGKIPLPVEGSLPRGNSQGAELSANRLLIVSSALPEDRLAEVRQFVQGGGTALFVMNDAGSARTLGALAGAPEIAAGESAPDSYAMLSRMDFEHPLLAPFADPRFSDFTKIRFWKHRRLQPDALPQARVVASFDDNAPAILEVPAGRGRLVVFTFSWRPADSQLALSTKFVPLLYSLLEQAGNASGQLAQYRVGDAVNLALPAANSGGAALLVVRKPDGSQARLAPGETRFLETDLPGIYEVASAPTPIRFAVNLDPAESKTAPLSVDELERLGLPLKARESLAPPPARAQQLHDADVEGRQKLWRWLIVAALMVLMIETWVAGRITRRAAAPVEAVP